MGQIKQDLVSHPALGAGQRKAQLRDKAVGQLTGSAHRRRLVRPHLGAQPQHGQLMGHQLLERQSVLGPVAAVLQGLEVDVRRRAVQQLYGFAQRRQLIGLGQLRRQPFGQVIAFGEPGQRRVTETAQTLLRQPFGGGVNRCQGIADRQRLSAVEVVQLWVIDFQSGGARPYFAIAAPAAAAAEVGLERGGKIVEAQAEGTAAVLNAAEQAAAPAHDHLSAEHCAFDDRVEPGA